MCCVNVDRRKLSSRVVELESILEQTKTKLSRLEKEKTKLTIHIEDITIHFEEVRKVVLSHLTPY